MFEVRALVAGNAITKISVIIVIVAIFLFIFESLLVSSLAAQNYKRFFNDATGTVF